MWREKRKAKRLRREERKLKWLRRATGLGSALPNIYEIEGFEPNGAGPARVFFGIAGFKWVPDWLPFTVSWWKRWKLTAAADAHDYFFWRGGDEADFQWANQLYRRLLLVARSEITGWLKRFRQHQMAKMVTVYYGAVRLFGHKSFNYFDRRGR